MHISEGVLSVPVLLSGAALTAAGTAVGLKKMDYDRLPQVAIMAAVFFVASLIHVPIGPSSVHLILNGLLGVLLGWSAFPAILIGLTLHAVLFQFGGLTSLGVNTLNMALPAVVCFYLFGPWIRNPRSALASTACFLAGFGAVFLASLMMGLSLFLTGESFVQAAQLIVAAHLPVMIAEGIFTAIAVQFLKKVRPEVLHVIYAR
ncbi:MAG: cobalt transporter CbiM [Proteobacteria bacterium]|nr:cobalt transporter CbiM [Pseudomonadota bacterium]